LDQFGKDLIGCHEVEYFAWPVVEAFGDFVEVVLTARDGILFPLCEDNGAIAAGVGRDGCSS
jgi:hypothetical protein